VSRIGVVIEELGPFAKVSTSRRGICEECTEKAGCSFDAALSGGRVEVVTVANSVGAQVGDTVEFDLPGHAELKISIVVWLTPLTGLLIGALAGSEWHQRLALSADLGTLLGAALGFLTAFIPVLGYDRLVARRNRLTPSILKKLPLPGCSSPDNKASRLNNPT